MNLAGFVIQLCAFNQRNSINTKYMKAKIIRIKK
jgi:hypothetical protein